MKGLIKDLKRDIKKGRNDINIYELKSYVFTFMLTLFICIVFILSQEITAFAGNINSEEARVISVASGTFTYNGKTYKAYSSYVNELYSYMASDGVDLTADQANQAIAYIYSNVQQGIDSGYVYEVSEQDKNNTDLDVPSDTDNGNSSDNGNGINTIGDTKGYSSDDSNSINLDVDTKQDKEDGKNKDTSGKTTKTAKEISDDEVAKMFDKVDRNHKEHSDFRKKPKATETDASVIMDEKEIIITLDEKEKVISVNNRIIPGQYSTIFVIVTAVIVIIDILIFIILIAKGCMRFSGKDRKKPRKGHRARRRIRKLCRNTLTVTTAIKMTLLFLIVSVSIGLYNNNKIIQNIQGSGYFRFAYTEYLSNVMEEENSEILSYDEFLVEEKKALDAMKVSELTQSRSIAPYIGRLQDDMRLCLVLSSIILILGVIISAVADIFMDLKRDRGIKSIAISVLFGTVITLVSAVLLKLGNLGGDVFIEPDYLYNFINEHLDWTIQIFSIVGLFGAVIGMSLVGLYISKRKDRS